MTLLIPKIKLTFEDYAALCFGLILWLLYLYPIWNIGTFSHPLDWLTILHAEGISLTTNGKWFFEYPHRFLTDAFSGDFPVFYQYVLDYLLNLLTKVTGIPPMVLASVIIGPFLGFIHVVLNYVFLSKTLDNKQIALIGSVLMAFMWHSRITDFYFTEHAASTPVLHVPFVALALCTDQGLGHILFVPVLCSMYLAYTNNSIQWKVYYGLLLGIVLQAHTLTFINILVINFCYLLLNNLFQFWKILTVDGKNLFAFILGSVLTLCITAIVFYYANASPFLLSPFTLLIATVVVFTCLFFLDKNKSFYLISYPVSLAISIPYLFVIIKELAIINNNGTPACIACFHFPMNVLIIYYFPHLLAALVGTWFLASGKFKNSELLIWVFSGILATLVLSYNHFVGWGNHPYRFAIHLLTPLMSAAAFGIYYGYIQGGIWKVVSVFLALWFIITIAFNVNDVFQDRRPYDNPVSGTQEQYDFLKQVQKNTATGDILFNVPGFSYPTGSVQSAILLNYSNSRGFIPDYRYLLSQERYLNRLKLFCYFFPSFPSKEICASAGGVIHLEDGNILKVKNNQIKNTILPVYGIKHIASFGEPFSTFIQQQADSFKWEILAHNSAGILARPAPITTLTGVATFAKGQYDAQGFTAKFKITKEGENVLIIAGNKLHANINKVFIDGQQATVQYQDDSLLLLKKQLTVGEHELVINSHCNCYVADYIYFLNMIHQSDFDKYLFLGKIIDDFDFIEHLNEAKASNLYTVEVKLSSDGKQFMTHPTTVPATLSYSNVPIKIGTKLMFGVDLKNSLDGVRYAIMINGESLFDRVYHAPADENYITISLDKYYGQKVNIDFIADPLKDHYGDSAFWKSPKIFIENKYDVSTLIRPQ